MAENLFGGFEHTMDEKGRVSIPAKFRKELPKTIVLAPGPEGQINVFDPEDFKKWKESIFEAEGGYKESNAQQSRARQFINNSSHSVDIDSAGRVNIPDNLKKYAGLQKNVYVNGDEDRVCIWDRSKWNDYIGDFGPEDFFRAS